MNAARLWRLQYLEALLLLGVCVPGIAQVTPADGDKAFATYRAMADALLKQEILPRVYDALPTADRTYIQTVPLEVTLERNPFETGLQGRDPNRAIRISAGFLVALDIASDATAAAAHTRRYQALPGYAAEYSLVIRQQWLERQGARVAPRMFADYIDWPEQAATEFRASPDYRKLRLAMMRQSLVWISAHYVGHLVLDRRKPPDKRTDARLREGQIDAFASDLAYSAGYSAMPPLANAVLFASIDHPEQSRDPSDWMCRATAVVGRGLDHIARYRRSSSTRRDRAWDSVNAEKTELHRLRKQYSCPSY